MALKIGLEDWGQIKYQDAWDRQKRLFEAALEDKKHKRIPKITLVFCEHFPVYTLGKSGNNQNLLISEPELEKIGAEMIKIDRGGDITFHGPGQLVAYPIFDLEQLKIGVKNYVFGLEEIIINTLNHFGLKGERIKEFTGVWLDKDTASARKIAAIGIKTGRYITMHGFAFNINTNLDFFSKMNPCGIIDKSVTSLEKELGEKINLAEVKSLVKIEFQKIFGIKI